MESSETQNRNGMRPPPLSPTAHSSLRFALPNAELKTRALLAAAFTGANLEAALAAGLCRRPHTVVEKPGWWKARTYAPILPVGIPSPSAHNLPSSMAFVRPAHLYVCSKNGNNSFLVHNLFVIQYTSRLVYDNLRHNEKRKPVLTEKITRGPFDQ